jgi:hypothetical protein
MRIAVSGVFESLWMFASANVFVNRVRSSLAGAWHWPNEIQNDAKYSSRLAFLFEPMGICPRLKRAQDIHTYSQGTAKRALHGASHRIKHEDFDLNISFPTILISFARLKTLYFVRLAVYRTYLNKVLISLNHL